MSNRLLYVITFVMMLFLFVMMVIQCNGCATLSPKRICVRNEYGERCIECDTLETSTECEDRAHRAMERGWE